MGQHPYVRKTREQQYQWKQIFGIYAYGVRNQESGVGKGEQSVTEGRQGKRGDKKCVSLSDLLFSHGTLSA